MRKRLNVVFLAVALLLALTACGGNKSDTTAETVQEKVITVALMSAWDSLMPMNSNSNYGDFVFDQIYERLVESTPDGTYSPQIAKSWEANEDSTAVIFHLDENAKWHDGTALTADDVVFSMKFYSNPEVEALSRYYLAVIDGTDNSGAELSKGSINVEAIDKHTVKITMKSAMFPGTLLLNIEKVAILPKHILEGLSLEEINGAELWANPVGSGPFKFASKIDGERMEFTANKDYHLGAPKIDKMVLRIVPANNLLSSLMSGEVDLLAGSLATIPLDDWGMTKEQDHLVATSVPSLNYQTFIINTEKPYMTQAVRQAISMAINRSLLVDSLLQGEGVPIVTPIVPSSPYYNSDVDVWYAPEKAKEILEAENFPFDTELTFLVPAGNVTRERASVLIQQDLQKLGLKVNIQTVDFPTLMESMRNSKHDFGIIGSGGTPDPGESRQMIDADSPVNFSLYRTTELSDLIDAGNAELTFEKRLPYFKAYQEKVREISAMPYLYSNNTLMAYNKRVKNIDLESFGVMTWKSWTWDVE